MTTITKRLLRWSVSFLGFPIAGGIEVLLVGRIDGLGAALAGGLVTGLGIGAIQGWALGADRGLLPRWTLATAAGLCVGGAQSVVLLPLLGRIALAWPFYLAGVWAAGWAVTTLGGISVDDQFAVFGAYGALVAIVLTAVLPIMLHRAPGQPR